MDTMIDHAVLIAGAWALSVISLRGLRDSEQAEKPLKDAAAIAVISLSILGSLAAAFFLGANQPTTTVEANPSTTTEGPLGVFLFLVPFFAMLVTYWRKLGETPENETTTATMRRSRKRQMIAWISPPLFVITTVFLVIIPTVVAASPHSGLFLHHPLGL